MSFRTPSLGHPPSSTMRASSSSSAPCLRSRRRRVLALAVLPLLVMPALAAGVAEPAGAQAVLDKIDSAQLAPGGSIAVPAAAAAATPAIASLAASLAADVLDPAATSAAATAAAAAAGGKTTRTDMRKKDAPFDGKDGRPHEGPFVEIEKSRGGKTGGAASEGDEPAQKSSVYIDGKKVPESNDGVMDDKNRESPKQGTTGTSGGVSEKDKQRKALEGQTGERVENTPETPKNVPALPHHEEEKFLGQDVANAKDGKDGKDEKVKDAASDGIGFGKPADLPDLTHDKAIPVPGSAQKDHLDVSKSSKPVSTTAGGEEDPNTLIQPLHSFLLSLTMILFSEVGDKTFLVAALMAMKHDRIVVFSAAFSALFAMTVLSAVLGHTVPVLIPKRLTNFLAAGLFLVFGARLLREGMGMGADEGVGAEMQEVEMELAEKESLARETGRRSSRAGVLSPDALEMGMGAGAATGRMPRSQSRFSTPSRSLSSSLSPPASRGWGGAGAGGFAGNMQSLASGLSNLASLLLSPAWVQTFVMTFLGEWGDRSQIATIAMAAGQDYWWVTLGAVIGHACCTGVAVVGGRALAGRVSMKVVTIGGAVSFLLFGVIYLVEAFYS